MSVFYPPGRGAIGNIKPMRFRSQHILPTEYEDSLSYYEVLDKVVSKLNEITLATNKLLDDDVAIYIRRQLNKIFNESFYLAEDERLVMVLNPAENIFIQDVYVSGDEKLVLSLTYREEICHG